MWAWLIECGQGCTQRCGVLQDCCTPQTIQREMSQIELQYEEMEEIGREVEQNLRDAEGSLCKGDVLIQ